MSRVLSHIASHLCAPSHRPVRLLLAAEAEGARAGADDVHGLVVGAVHHALHSVLTTLADTPTGICNKVHDKWWA